MWVSDRLEVDPRPWLELAWSAAQRMSEIVIIFDDDVNEDLINLHHHRTPFDVLPTLVRDYRVEARLDGMWTTVVEASGNRHRRRNHRLPDAVYTDGIRVVVEETNGAPAARVISVRAYE